MTSIIMGTLLLLVMLLIQRKRYDVSLGRAICVHIIVTLLTILGARVGALLGGLSIKGLRLYGMLMVDTVALYVLAKPMKMEIGRLGDYIAAPMISVCSIVKIECFSSGCCYGIELFKNAEGNAVRFPSQIVELLIWASLAVVILLIERKGYLKNMLWSFAAVWFGVFRFIVDFLRGSASEMELKILGLHAGKFWSIVVLLMGIGHMVYCFRRYNGRFPAARELFRVCLGMNPLKDAAEN